MSALERQPGASTALAGQGAGIAFAASTVRHPAVHQAQRSVARQRKLHVGQFAFLRALIQWLDPRDNWVRYLMVEGDATDLRAARANQGLKFELHLLYAIGQRLSKVVAATVDDMQRVKYAAVPAASLPIASHRSTEE